MSRHARVFAIVTTWPFVAGLLVLLANDLWLKQAMPGLVAGKLSDFAGIAVVTLLLGAAWPQRPVRIGVAVALGFAWWKSPLSQPVIEALNVFLPAPIGRVVDMTDLVALCVIPLCQAVVSAPARHALPGRALRRALTVPVIALTTLGLMGTSVLPTRDQYQIRRPDAAPELDREAIAATIAQVAGQHGLACIACADRTVSAHYGNDDLWLRYRFVGARTIAFDADATSAPFSLFGPSGRQKVERLRRALKSQLAAEHAGLEYVEPLDQWPYGRQ